MKMNKKAANRNKNVLDRKGNVRTTGSRKIRTCLATLSLLTLISMSACTRHKAATGAEISTRAEVTEVTANEGSAHESAANQTEQMASMPNPFTDHTSLADAQKAAGFSIRIPETIQGVSANVFRTLGSELIEVIYLKDYDAKSDQTDAAADNRTSEISRTEIARIRKGLYDKNSAADSADISGDYNTYSEVFTTKIGTREVTMKSDNGMVKTAIWTDGGYAYSISTDGISADEISALIAKIQ